MRTRRAAVVAASLGLLGGGAAWTMSPALAASPATIDDTVPDDTESTTGGDETATATEAEPSSDETSDEASDGATADDQTGAVGELGDDETPATGDSWIDDVLAELVADGTLSQSQADAVGGAFEDAMPVLGGRGDVVRPDRVGRIAIGLDVAADALGVTTEELVTALGEGQSIADVAEAHGVELQTVIDALVATASARIDEAVAAGELTDEEGAERLAIATERVNELVNRPGGLPRPGRPDRPGTNWPGGFPGEGFPGFPGFPGGGFPGQPNDDGAFPSLGGPGHDYGHDEWDGSVGPAPTDGPSSMDSSAADAGDSTDLDTADA